MSSLSIPPELQQPIPRLTKPSATFVLSCVLYLGLTSVVILALVFFLLADGVYSLKHFGTEITGEVKSINITQSQTKHGMRDNCHVTYKYVVSEALPRASKSFVHEGVVPIQECYAHNVGQPIAVMYNSAMPEKSALKNQETIGVVPLIVQIPMVLIIISIMWWGYLRDKKLLTYGTPAIAKIIDRKIIRGGKGGPTLTLTVEFPDAFSGTIKTSKSGVLVKSVPEGSTEVVVIYNPGDELKICVYPPRTVVCVMPKAPKDPFRP